MDYKRSERVAGDIKAQLCDIILKEIKDPLIGFITITNVVVSDDLKIAKIYFSSLGSVADKEKTYKGLMRAKGFLRKELSTRIRLRSIPELRFFIDDSLEKVSKIEELLKKIN